LARVDLLQLSQGDSLIERRTETLAIAGHSQEHWEPEAEGFEIIHQGRPFLTKTIPQIRPSLPAIGTSHVPMHYHRHACIYIAASAIAGTYILATITLSSITLSSIARKRIHTSSQYLHARRALPLPITAIAFLAANCGALEIVGLVATIAKYGILALHFYWLGAIPAIIFLSLFMMPIYARSGAMTVPDFLQNIRLQVASPDLRPALIFDHVQDVAINGLNVQANASAESALRIIDSKDILLTAPRLLTSTPTFLQLEGADNQNITIDGGDISKAQKPLTLADKATKTAIKIRS
jgi:hypothetical protein